tara:strand:- start:2275 stop:3087 length:813 start_codon:yes stop_codon:yes gene_type:complete
MEPVRLHEAVASILDSEPFANRGAILNELACTLDRQRSAVKQVASALATTASDEKNWMLHSMRLSDKEVLDLVAVSPTALQDVESDVSLLPSMALGGAQAPAYVLPSSDAMTRIENLARPNEAVEMTEHMLEFLAYVVHDTDVQQAALPTSYTCAWRIAANGTHRSPERQLHLHVKLRVTDFAGEPMWQHRVQSFFAPLPFLASYEDGVVTDARSVEERLNQTSVFARTGCEFVVAAMEDKGARVASLLPHTIGPLLGAMNDIVSRVTEE